MLKNNFIALLGRKGARDAQLYTPTDCAKAIGVDRRKLYALRDTQQDGKINLTLAELDRLLDYLDCYMSDLLERVGD